MSSALYIYIYTVHTYNLKEKKEKKKKEKMKEDEEGGAIKDTELKMQLGKTTRCIISASKLCSCCCCFGVVVFCLLCGNGKLTDSLHPFP